MHRAERDVWLLAVGARAPNLRQRLLLLLRLTENRPAFESAARRRSANAVVAGQVQFIGFHTSDKARSDTLEAQCDATYPLCGCAAQQPTTDDGSRLRFSDQAGVTCLQGKCTTFVPDCGEPCGAGTTCFSCSNHNSAFAACTTMCTDSSQCTTPALPLCQIGMSGNTAGKFCTAANVVCDSK